MSIVESKAIKYTSSAPEKTRRVGAQVGALLQHGDVICLQGDLGAGKTTFVQGIAKGWGSQDSVSSPTFILVNEYRREGTDRLFHMDAYRLDSAPEAEQLDLDSMLADGPLLIEWPERLGAIVPEEHLWIQLTHTGAEEREMQIKAVGKRYEELLAAIHASGVL